MVSLVRLASEMISNRSPTGRRKCSDDPDQAGGSLTVDGPLLSEASSHTPTQAQIDTFTILWVAFAASFNRFSLYFLSPRQIGRVACQTGGHSSRTAWPLLALRVSPSRSAPDYATSATKLARCKVLIFHANLSGHKDSLH